MRGGSRIWPARLAVFSALLCGGLRRRAGFGWVLDGFWMGLIVGEVRRMLFGNVNLMAVRFKEGGNYV